MDYSSTDKIRICKNCNSEVSQKYCPNCGLPAQLKRIDSHYLAHEIEHLLHIEKGFFFTAKALITNPGQEIRIYLLENRSKLVKPIVFIIVTSLIYSVINHFFLIEEAYVKNSELTKSATVSLFQWVQAHYGYANILMGFFIALWIKLLFRKYPYNLFEILILLCFVMGMGMLILALFALSEGLTHIPLLVTGTIAAYIYSAWAMAHFFDKGKVINYVKSFSAYILGMITFYLLLLALGSAFDLIS